MFSSLWGKVFSILLWPKFFWICILLIYQKNWVACVRSFTVHHVIWGRIYWYNNRAKKIFIWEEMGYSQVTGRNCTIMSNGACSVQGRQCHYTHICVTGMMSTVELPPHGRQMSHYTSPHVTGTHMEGNSWRGPQLEGGSSPHLTIHRGVSLHYK